jgi:hypothetical protein
MASLFIFFGSAFSRAATLQTIDGKTVVGDIRSFDKGDLEVQPKSEESGGKAPASVKIPLREIVQLSLSWQERIAASTVAASQPAELPELSWQVDIGVSDQVQARITSWSDAGVTLAVSALDDASFTIPPEQLRAFWAVSESRPGNATTPGLVKKARELAVSAPGQDVAYVESGDDVKSVAGIALGFDDGYLRFKYENQERKIKLERLVGLVLAQRQGPREKNLYEVFTFSSGDVLSARIQSLVTAPGKDNDPPRAMAFVCLPLALGGQDAKQTFNIPIGKIDKMAIRNGRLTWLGDLVPSSVEQVPYFDRVIPYQVDHSLSGGDLHLTGNTDEKLDHGIAVHTECHLAYDLGGAYESFRVKVGFQQPDGKLGRAALRILADGKVLWENPDFKGTDKPVALDLDVAGAKTLRLEADFGEGQDVQDDVVWGDARLLKAISKREP